MSNSLLSPTDLQELNDDTALILLQFAASVSCGQDTSADAFKAASTILSHARRTERSLSDDNPTLTARVARIDAVIHELQRLRCNMEARRP